MGTTMAEAAFERVKRLDQESGQAEKFRGLLERVIADNELHARWLNMLSYLEFVGSRKIFKTQRAGVLNEEILKHASDEARHALVLKQMCLKLDVEKRENFENEDLLCGFSAYRYFQSLDSTAKQTFEGEISNPEELAYRCYVYVSYIIEVRANWLYGVYAALLKKASSPVSVSAIIHDEVRHLEDMSAEIRRVDSEYEARIEEFLAKEERFFLRFLDTFERTLGAA